jgi:CheY-like chemotaxis protein
MKKLLFVDDSPLDHFILKRILNKYNLSYDVTCSANGEEVIDFLSLNRLEKDILPDIILLDLYMPLFNGWEFLNKVSALHPHLAKPLNIYILSSSINPYDIAQALEYPFVKSFMFKPITRETLEKTINAAIPDNRGSSELA